MLEHFGIRKGHRLAFVVDPLEHYFGTHTAGRLAFVVDPLEHYSGTHTAGRLAFVVDPENSCHHLLATGIPSRSYTGLAD